MGERPSILASAIADHVMIRGRRLDIARHVDPRLFDPAYVDELRRQVANARPFPHLVVHDWFDPVLLELVREEFDLIGQTNWKSVIGDQQRIHRSTTFRDLGPASQIYFGIVNSGWFVELLSQITRIEELLPDPQLFGGGLHETRAGGSFGIHRDFDRHVRHGLENRMVLMTYLNRDWNPDWGASLELWGGEPLHCELSIPPEFGTTVLLLHGPASFHGHPHPMTAPEGRTRRSVATYYYRNSQSVTQRAGRVTTVFLAAHKSRTLRQIAGRVLPPVIVDAIKRFVSR